MPTDAPKSLNSRHDLHLCDARNLAQLHDGSVQLVVTSPPYPMIEMWDEAFVGMAPQIGAALAVCDGNAAFDLMHKELDHVWRECRRVLAPGGIACINIGDATRTINSDFQMFPNHVRIVHGMRAAGFSALPDILWRKPTNAPNKFMGSGMLPAGAYVTYEHEYILIFRNGAKREFAREADKATRRRSAYFWEERNTWFSDMWTDLVGARQAVADPDSRARSAAFPFELPYRLIQMFSVQGDTVLDPFVGTGTTMTAAIASARNSIGVEHDRALAPKIAAAVMRSATVGCERLDARLRSHEDFVRARIAQGKVLGHVNQNYGFPVITGQETELVLYRPKAVAASGANHWSALHDADTLQTVAAPPSEVPLTAASVQPTR